MLITAAEHKNILKSGALFLPLFKKEPLNQTEVFSYLPKTIQIVLEKFAKSEFSGEEGEIKYIWHDNSGKYSKIVLFGLGYKKEWNHRKAVILARRMVKYAKSEKIKEFSTVMAHDDSARQGIFIFASNAELANFEFNEYKKLPPEGWPKIDSVQILCKNESLSETEKGIREGKIVGEETNLCRHLANTPGSNITPAKLAKITEKVAQKNKISVKILNEKEMDKLGMGGMLGVSRGSSQKPRFIVMEYLKGPKNQKPLVLVGKGVTFDTGGLSLKPEQYMYEMHMDMSGGAAVIHGMAAIARLGLQLNAVALIPAVENMPSGNSYRPGDILKILSGKTVEVLNTDAEGRIILADALSYALRYKPGFILDLATLTGAAHVALGNYCSALFTNCARIQDKLMEIGESSGDYVWPLPLWSEYLNDIKGTFADLANTSKGDRYGGAIHGAKFLEQFVEETPWAHLDIAPKMTTNEYDCLAKGASGVGVRYIVELAKKYDSGISD